MMATKTRHNWQPVGALTQTCQRCGLQRVSISDGWRYTWLDGTVEDKDVEDRVPVCPEMMEKPAQVEQQPATDWWNR